MAECSTSSFLNYYSPSLRTDRQRYVMNEPNSMSSESQDEPVTIPRKQKEITKLKYIRRRRRPKRNTQKTSVSSSDSESTAAARKSLELFSLCEYNRTTRTTSPHSLLTNEVSFSQQDGLHTNAIQTNPSCPVDTASCQLQGSLLKFEPNQMFEFDGRRTQAIVSSSRKAKNTNWYSNLFGGIFGYVANYIFNSKENVVSDKPENIDISDFESDFNEDIEEMAKKVLQRVSQFCPEGYREELKERCILPLQHKLNQRGVTIGICGKSQYGKKLLMKVIESRRESGIGDVSYRLCFCPSVEDGTLPIVETNTSHGYFLSEQATCAAYVYILSSEYEDSMDSLKWLIERDKDVLTQGRLLILATDDVLHHSPSSPFTHIPQNTVDSHCSPNTTHNISPTTPISIFTQRTNHNMSQILPSNSIIAQNTNHTTSPITLPNLIITQNTNHSTSPITPPNSIITQSTNHTTSSTFTLHTTTQMITSTPYATIIRALPHDIPKHSQSVHDDSLHNRDKRLLSKIKIQSFFEDRIGVIIPKSCIILCPSEWMDVTSKELNYESSDSLSYNSIEDTNSQYDIESIFGFEDDKIESLANGEVGIGQWLRQLSVKSDMLRQLSITSDTLHCIEYCINRLQYQLDDYCGEIDKLEMSIAHKNHLMIEMKQLWCHLEVQSKEHTLYQQLSSCYDVDTEATVKMIKECAGDILNRYQTVCLTKLEKLSQTDSFSSLSIKDIYHLFKTDVDGFTCETVKYLNTLHSNVLFYNMHNTLKLRYNSIHELNSLKQLSDSYLHSEPNSGNNSPDSFVYDNLTGGILYYPCGLETIGCNGFVKSAPISDIFYSILLVLASRVFKSCNEKMAKTDLKKLTVTFISHCTQYLKSDIIRDRSVEYHVELLSRLILSHADVFKKHYTPHFTHIYHQLELNLLNIKRDHTLTELRFKHLINLKVHLELKKSFLSFCLK